MIQRSLLNPIRALNSSTQTPLSRLSRPSRILPTKSRPSQLHTRITTRWYSETAEAKKDAESAAEPAKDAEAPTEAGASAAEQSKPPEQEDPIKKELDAKTREVIDLKDKYLRAVADFRNLQDRTKREVQSARDFALQRFAKDILDTVDNLERALTTVPADKLDAAGSPDLVNLHGGLKMTESILMQTLKRHGLVRFDPSEDGGQRFDPNVHEATFMTPQPDKEDGVVFHTQQKGFMLNGRVLRAAKVGVVKNS